MRFSSEGFLFSKMTQVPSGILISKWFAGSLMKVSNNCIPRIKSGWGQPRMGLEWRGIVDGRDFGNPSPTSGLQRLTAACSSSTRCCCRSGR